MKTICISHSRDLDGWMSTAIVKKYYNGASYCSVCEKPLPKHHTGSTECCGGITITNEPVFLGWDYGDEIPDLSGYDKVIMVDVAFPAEKMYETITTKEVVWIDHHISAIKDMQVYLDKGVHIKGARDTKFAACELTWQYFFPEEKMPEIVRLLGMYDSFRHKGTDEEQKVLEFQYGARAYMSNYQECYDNLNQSLFFSDGLSKVIIEDEILKNGSVIYKYLCTEARQTYEKAFPIMFPADGGGHHAFLCVNQERFNPINFGIDYHKEGYCGFACFWYEDKKWNWSLYNDDGKVNCSIIAKQYGGGGHKGAAGMVVDDLSKIF